MAVSRQDHARRLVGAYGTRVDNVLGTADRALDDLGVRFGSDLTATEVRYLMPRNGRDRR